MEDLKFPTFAYNLDRSDPDVVILRRRDGSFVAAFSASGATREGILEAAWEDRRKWLRHRAIGYIVRGRSGGELNSSR
jgi:hypothetical protein